MTPNKKIIGITGNSGSGKTTVANILKDMGGHAIDADTVAHGVMDVGKPAYKKIISAFGDEILDTCGKIDRAKLAKIVFNDVKRRTQLEKIVHPMIMDEILAELEQSDAPIVAVDAVLLVEGGLHHHCDAIWLITAQEEKRLRRITTRDNLSSEAAEARMRNQRDTTHISELAQAVIKNDGDLSFLTSQIKEALNQIG